MRQSRPRLPSGAYIAPSGPVVMSAGTAKSAGSLYSFTCVSCAAAGAARAANVTRTAAAVLRARFGMSALLRGDVVAAGEQVGRVVLRLDGAQALPHGGSEEATGVARLLDEVGIVAGAVGLQDRVEVRERVAHRDAGRFVDHDAQRHGDD